MSVLSWLRKEATSSFVIKKAHAEGAAEAGSGVMKIDWSNSGTSRFKDILVANYS